MLFDFKTFFEALWESSAVYGYWLLGLTLLLIFVMSVHRYRLRNLPIRTSCNDLGELFVTRNAILRLIDNIGTELNLGHINRIRLKDRKHLLCIQLHVRIFKDQAFEQVSMQFQEKVQQIVTKYLGVVKNVRVDVILDGIEQASKDPDLV